MSENAVLAAYLSLAPQSPEASVLRLLVEMGTDVVGAEEGSLLVLDEKSHELVFAITVGSRTPSALVGQRVPMGKGLTGLAALTREVQVGAPTFYKVQQPEGDPHKTEPQAVIAAPMLIADELVGVITAVSFDSTRRFGAREEMLYGRLATAAALIVQQRRQIALLRREQGGDEKSGGTREERAILAAVEKITAAGPETLHHVATVLGAIAELTARHSR